MRAYLSAKNCIVVLEIPVDARTNLDRSDVVEMSHAKFRCNEAMVVDIYNKQTKDRVDEIASHSDPCFNYRVGEMIKKKYSLDSNAVYTGVIHFYLTEESAYYHDLTVRDGVGKEWYPNGRMRVERNLLNGLRHGVQRYWYQSFNAINPIGLEYEFNCMNGLLQGLARGWYWNGRQSFECNYLDGMVHGKLIQWYDDGRVHTESIFDHGLEIETEIVNQNGLTIWVKNHPTVIQNYVDNDSEPFNLSTFAQKFNQKHNTKIITLMSMYFFTHPPISLCFRVF